MAQGKSKAPQDILSELGVEDLYNFLGVEFQVTDKEVQLHNDVRSYQSIRAQADLFADRKFAVDQAGWQPETRKIYGLFLKLYIGT